LAYQKPSIPRRTNERKEGKAEENNNDNDKLKKIYPTGECTQKGTQNSSTNDSKQQTTANTVGKKKENKGE